MADDLDLTENERIIDQVVVRVWRLSNLWWTVFLIPLIFTLPYAQTYPQFFVPAFLFLLWGATYFIRQRWRLTLTNRQIVARQLLPRPLTTISRIFYFPLNKIEGLSIGPRAFRTILLIGVFVSTNLGITLLKSGLSKQAIGVYDLPDTVDALLLILRGVSFLPLLANLADGIENAFITIYDLTDDILIGLGIVFIILGVVTVLLTIPRRYHLQIRVRHGADFRLSAGIPRKFWEKCYNQLYEDEIVEPPEEYKKWKFPWLKGEKPETSADLEEVIYTNRFIGLFAIYAGSSRIIQQVREETLGENLLLWIFVAAVDVFIAIVAVTFSKKKNEMLVTNRRVIFAQEMQDISGAFGKRLYLMSDIRRDDIAGFRIYRLRGISYLYLILTIAFTIITVVFWDQILIPRNPLGTVFMRAVFIFVILLLGTFILQTYLEFNLKTKGNEIWNMRHQLSNPLTMMRELVGNEENPVLTTLMSNRLEEKEIVDTIQILRASELDLTPKLFQDSKYFGQTYNAQPRTTREVDIQDLLLHDESIKYETNVSRGVPRRKLNLSIATFLMLAMSGTLITPLTILDDLEGVEPIYILVLLGIGVFLIPFLIIALWIRYYSLFKARILFTEKRVFFTDIKKPPLLLYLLGITEESTIEETLQSQVHSTYSSRQLTQQQYFRDFLYHSSRFVLYGMLFGLAIAFLFGATENLNEIGSEFPGILLLLPVLVFFIYVGSLSMTWHLGNLYIAAIRSFPRRVVHTQGIGSHFIVPFASKEKANNITETVWEGIITEEITND